MIVQGLSSVVTNLNRIYRRGLAETKARGDWSKKKKQRSKPKGRTRGSNCKRPNYGWLLLKRLAWTQQSHQSIRSAWYFQIKVRARNAPKASLGGKDVFTLLTTGFSKSYGSFCSLQHGSGKQRGVKRRPITSKRPHAVPDKLSVIEAPAILKLLE